MPESYSVTKILLIFYILTSLFVIFSVSAGDDLDIWGSVSPEGSLAPGDEINCSYTIEYDFDSDAESLVFYSDLYDPNWKFTISIDGKEQEKPKETGRYKTISGFDLYYSGSYQTLVKVNLNGIVPNVSTTGNYSIFDVTHYDALGEAESFESVQRIFLNPSDLVGIQESMEIKLSNLQSDIYYRNSEGVNTTLAEVKYTNAYNAVSVAKNSTPSIQSSLLSSADEFINEANSILDISWAEYSLDKVDNKINSVDSMISYFEDSEGLSDDSRVWVVKSYNDNAKTLLVLAKDKFDSHDYDLTRDYADQAESKADEAYSYASALNDELNLNAPAETGLWSTSVSTSTPSPAKTESNVLNSNISAVEADSENIEDIDSLLHSEVDLKSFLQIAGKIYDLLIDAFNFLNELIASASDN